MYPKNENRFSPSCRMSFHNEYLTNTFFFFFTEEPIEEQLAKNEASIKRKAFYYESTDEDTRELHKTETDFDDCKEKGRQEEKKS